MNKYGTYSGKVIRKYRLMQNMSQEDLGFAVGTDASPIGKLERNEANPTVVTLAKVASALKIPIAELFEDDPNLNPDEDASLRRIKYAIGGLTESQRENVADVVASVVALLQTTNNNKE